MDHYGLVLWVSGGKKKFSARVFFEESLGCWAVCLIGELTHVFFGTVSLPCCGPSKKKIHHYIFLSLYGKQ
jgi:hypothetical protein